MPEIELLLDCRAVIGESPTWFAPGKALYWIDVKAPSLHRLSVDGVQTQWRFDADIGAFALVEDAEGAIVALRTGIFRLDFSTGETHQLAPPPFDPNLFRFNEGVCDAEGRFWVGVMFDPRPGVATETAAAPLHRFTFGEGLVAGDDWSDLHNGFAWNVEEDAFFLSHSNARSMLRAPYDRARGRVGKPSSFAEIRTEGHVPDGAAVDEEGCYWCAVHGGGVLHRYDRSGRLMSQIALPVSQPTMCAFVGPDLDEMIVSSARDKLTEDQLKREPQAGGLFRLRPGVRGLSRPCIAR